MRVWGNDDDNLQTLGGEWYHQREILITVAHMQNQKSALNKGDLLLNTQHCMNHIGRAVASCHQRENSEIPQDRNRRHGVYSCISPVQLNQW